MRQFQRLRSTFHDGVLHGAGAPDEFTTLTGVVSCDAAQGVYVLAQDGVAPWSPGGRVRLHGLDPAVTYRVRILEVDIALATATPAPQPGWVSSGVELSGRALAVHGLAAPVMDPDTALVIEADSRGIASSVEPGPES